MEGCIKNFGAPSTANLSTIDTFCKALRSNKVKEGKELFYKLPRAVQCLFLHYGKLILMAKEKYSEDSYLTAFRLFKLFRSKEDKVKTTYMKYNSADIEYLYKKAFDWNKSREEKDGEKSKSPKSSIFGSKSPDKSPKSSPNKSSPSSPPVPRTKKKFENEYQRYDTPESTDPLYIFYTTLYEEKPDSPLAITWLTEHGLYPEGKKKKILQAYKDGNIIKLR